MSLTRWRKPHKLTLPGGYTIPVVYWSRRKIAKDLKHDKVFAEHELYGYWDGNKIVINKDEPVWTQIETLGHETVHAVHDYAHWLKQKYADPIMAEAGETALEDLDEGR